MTPPPRHHRPRPAHPFKDPPTIPTAKAKFTNGHIVPLEWISVEALADCV